MPEEAGGDGGRVPRLQHAATAGGTQPAHGQVQGSAHAIRQPTRSERAEEPSRRQCGATESTVAEMGMPEVLRPKTLPIAKFHAQCQPRLKASEPLSSALAAAANLG